MARHQRCKGRLRSAERILPQQHHVIHQFHSPINAHRIQNRTFFFCPDRGIRCARFLMMFVRARGLMAILLLLGNPFVRGGTNSPPPLILKGQPNTNSAAQRWSPWSCWWLMPASNAPVRTDLSEADIAESGVSNKLAEASTPGSEMTNAVSDLTQTNADVSSNDR